MNGKKMVINFAIVILCLGFSTSAYSQEKAKFLPLLVEGSKDVYLNVTDASLGKQIVHGNTWNSYYNSLTDSGGKIVTEPVTIESSTLIEIPGQEPIKITTVSTQLKTTVYNPYNVLKPDQIKDHPGWRYTFGFFGTVAKSILYGFGIDRVADVLSGGYANAGHNNTYNGPYAPANSFNTVRGESSYTPSGDVLYGSKQDSDWNISDNYEGGE